MKCPVCSDFMQRKNFGARSGVIADRCNKHGIWLDGGELKRLMEWKKAGGQLLHEKMVREKEVASQKGRHAENTVGGEFAERMGGSRRKEGIWASQDDDLVSVVFRLVEKLF